MQIKIDSEKEERDEGVANAASRRIVHRASRQRMAGETLMLGWRVVE